MEARVPHPGQIRDQLRSFIGGELPHRHQISQVEEYPRDKIGYKWIDDKGSQTGTMIIKLVNILSFLTIRSNFHSTHIDQPALLDLSS